MFIIIYFSGPPELFILDPLLLVTLKKIKKSLIIIAPYFKYHITTVTPQNPDIKISLNKCTYQSTSQRSVTFSTSKSLNKINISLSFAKYSITAAEIINQILQKGLGPRPHKSIIIHQNT